MLPTALVSNQPQQLLLESAFATFPGENGKLAFVRYIGNQEVYVMNADGSEQTNISHNPLPEGFPNWSPDGTKIAFTRTVSPGNDEIYVMNADGSEQTRLTNNLAVDDSANFGPATETLEEDTTPPVLTVPEDITAQATTANGGTVVTYNVTAEDNVDGTATLEEDNSLTQDDVGGNIAISCEPSSGSEFPVGETIVECTATDAAGNSDTASFTVTVNPPPPTPPRVGHVHLSSTFIV